MNKLVRNGLDIGKIDRVETEREGERVWEDVNLRLEHEKGTRNASMLA